MNAEDFFHHYLRREPFIEQIAQKASQIHAEVNQTYGDGLPYAFHLRLTASYVTRFAHLLLDSDEEIDTLYAAAWFHDSIEDARLTYNDLKKIFTQLNVSGCRIDVVQAAELVYALTNDKGRTREERAGDNYYAGIRQVKGAPFLKMCDRLANVHYSTLFGIHQRMAEVYAREMPHFLAQLGDCVPQEMIAEANRMLNEGYKRP
ncbi:MAG: phosphodiesterase [Bacteroidales bacterium]|nr:phosphodiesterase [Bacteroidales bacterium]